MTYDVAIIGAGSNGSTAAYFLAKKGLKTLLIEASRVPGEKCHGATEYVPGVIFANRPDLVELMLRVIKKIPHLHPGDLGKGGYYYYVNDENRAVYKTYTEAPGDGWKHTYGVHNCDFVKTLSDEAVKAGAALKTNTVITDVLREKDTITGVITEKGDKIKAKLTIAADGRISTIAKKVGLHTKWNPKQTWYQYGEAWKFRSEEEMFEYVDYGRHMFFGSPITPPYPWQACTMGLRPGGIVTVNAPTSWTPLTAMAKEKKNSRSVYIQNLYKLMEMKRMLRVCEGFPHTPFQRQSCFLPGPPIKKPYMAGLIICGDAAAVGGICGAGHIAAKYVIPHLEQGDVSEEALSGFAKARFPRGLASEDDKAKAEGGTRELGEVSPTRLMHWSTGAGYIEQFGCTVSQMVENMRIAASPVILGAPSPDKVGEFGYVELGAWMIASKISHLLNLYGPFLNSPTVFPLVLKWVQRNQDAFNKTKVFDHVF
jgi:flavin-dependent dehydrogenase